MPRLADVTTLRVGGPADAWVVAATEQDAIAAVSACDASGIPVLVLGGGSNLVVSDAGFRGTVVQMAMTGLDAQVGGESVRVTVAAGEVWDDVVSRCVARGWSGVEALSGIPGRAGATPVQNVGAYGQEIAQVLVSVRVYDRVSSTVLDLPASECGFGYRMSRFKSEPARWLVLAMTLDLSTSGLGEVRYAELATLLGVEVGAPVASAAIRGAVLALRSRKAMVLDAGNHDAWSAGSFFTNPVVSPEVAERIPDGCPRYPAVDGVKLSAAWLIEQSGVGKGFALPGSRAAISTVHTLALTNRGGATAAEVLDLAAAVQEAVRDRFAIDLVPEPVIL